MRKSVFNFNAFQRPSPEELIAAADKGDLEAAKKMLGWDLYGWKIGGVDINGTNKDGENALMRSSAKGHSKFVNFLRDEFADTTAKDKWGRTAKYRAEKTLHREIAKTLETSDKVQRDTMLFQLRGNMFI
ncbi:MAG: ankyrin repeat domain-containing protein [Pseudomonadota bacterium]